MTEIVMLFAEKWNISPFEVLEKDIDDFILIANGLIERNKTENHAANDAAQNKAVSREKYDFWDM